MMKYARDGWAFFSVETPSTFLEYELPLDPDALSGRQAAKLERLERLAETHGTAVQSCTYERG